MASIIEGSVRVIKRLSSAALYVAVGIPFYLVLLRPILRKIEQRQSAFNYPGATIETANVDAQK